MFENTVVLDFETSGLNPYHDDIIEIGAKIFLKEQEYTTLIKTKKLLDPKITSNTGITQNMLVKDGVSSRQAYHGFGEFIRSNCDIKKPIYILAHNGNSFDFIFFKKIVKTLQFKLDIRYIDTISVSKFVNPKLYSHKLATLCHPNIYNIKNDNAHRAMSDVVATEKIFEKICADGRHNFNSIEEVYNALEFN